MAYDPSTDYAASYDALSRRISSNFASQRAGLNQELATRGVQTSGESAIPSAALRVGENNAKDQVAGEYALEQAHTGIEDRRAAEAFSRQMQLAQLGWNNQNALAQKQASSGLTSALISGGLGAAGAALAPNPYALLTTGAIGRRIATNNNAGSAGGYAPQPWADSAGGSYGSAGGYA